MHTAETPPMRKSTGRESEVENGNEEGEKQTHELLRSLDLFHVGHFRKAECGRMKMEDERRPEKFRVFDSLRKVPEHGHSHALDRYTGPSRPERASHQLYKHARMMPLVPSRYYI